MSKMIGAETAKKVNTQPLGKMVTLLLAGANMLSGIGQLMQFGGIRNICVFKLIVGA
ncbi:hypothetical protein [Paenibacillus lautus]|uniref:hypothetical protein n=1 Tax=Paenibacillus lautus TaxID=1401 RepID=UPI003F5A2C11